MPPKAKKKPIKSSKPKDARIVKDAPVAISDDLQIPKDWVPLFVWQQYFYKQQRDFIMSTFWQTWFISGNGCGKTLLLYWNAVAYMLGVHPRLHTPPILDMNPPIKIKVLVPSFDYVNDVALDKLLQPQEIVFEDKNNVPQQINVGPLLPSSVVLPKRGYSKDHNGIELRNGSSIWWVTSEQGWKFMRGSEHDVLLIDEEADERVFDENVRGLRNAKGGGKVCAGLTPPYEEGKGPTWTKEKVVDAATTDPDIEIVHACMADNPAITDQFIQRFSKGKTKEQVDVQVYGKYPTWGDLVHPDFEDWFWDKKRCSGHLLRNDHSMPEDWEVDWVMAFDWHPSKPCAAVFGFIDRDGNVTFFDELDKDVSKGKDIDDLSYIFQQIEGIPHERRKFRRWQDPSAKSSYNAVQRGFNAWDAFRKAGIVTSAGKNRDPFVGISLVNEYFRGNGTDRPRIFIYERCKFLRQYLRNHYWKRGEDGLGKPDPKWSDYPICMRYILQEVGWTRKNKARKANPWPLQSFRPPEEQRQVVNLERWL